MSSATGSGSRAQVVLEWSRRTLGRWPSGERGDPRSLRTRWLLLPLGVALVLFGVGAILVSAAFDVPQEGRRLPGVFPVNPGAADAADISANNSPTLVRSPTDGRKLALADRIDTPGYSCALYVSSNGGATWSQRPVPAPGGERKCYAPEVAFGADGTLYMSFVTLRGEANVPNAAWLVTSKDGGRTLSAPRRILTGLPFQVRLTTDPKQAGRLYVTWLDAADVGLYRFTGPGNPIRTMRSDNGGIRWSQAARVSGPRHARALAPASAVGPGGEVYVLYLDLGNDRLDYEGGHGGRGGPPYPGPWKLVLARSKDAGASWEEAVIDDQLKPIQRFVVFIPPLPSVAVDPGSGRVYASYQDGRLGDPDVLVWSSKKDGDHWEGPTRVNDTPERDKTAQYLPKLAVAPNGRLDVAYYDRRADRRNVMNEVSLQSSSDEGETFTPRVRATDKPFDSRIGFGSERGLPDLGSRLGLISTDSRAIAVWADTRAGTRASNKQDIARAVVAFSDPTRLSDPVKYLLRIGGIALIFAGLVALAAVLVRRLPTAAAAVDVEPSV